MDHRSALLDLKILWRTVFIALAKEGVNSPGRVSGPEPFRGSPPAEAPLTPEKSEP